VSHGTRLANAVENVARFAAVGRVYGVEGLLNTDWGDGGHRNTLGVSMHGVAHGAAHAWHGRDVDDNRFTEAYCAARFPGWTCAPWRQQSARSAGFRRCEEASAVHKTGGATAPLPKKWRGNGLVALVPRALGRRGRRPST